MRQFLIGPPVHSIELFYQSNIQYYWLSGNKIKLEFYLVPVSVIQKVQLPTCSSLCESHGLQFFFSPLDHFFASINVLPYSHGKALPSFTEFPQRPSGDSVVPFWTEKPMGRGILWGMLGDARHPQPATDSSRLGTLSRRPSSVLSADAVTGRRSRPSKEPWHRVLPSLAGSYWVILGYTGFYWVLLDFTGFYWVLHEFDWVLLGFTGTELVWVLLGFTKFYQVLLGFTGF